MKISRIIPKKENGFTLMEVLVYTAILFIVVAVLSSYLIWTMRSSNKTQAMNEVTDNVQSIMTILSYEIRGAESIYTPTTSPTQLSLETSKYLAPGEDIGYLDFYLYDGNFFMKEDSQSNPIELNSDKITISNLTFEVISTTSSAPSVRVSFEASYKNPDNRPDLSASMGATSTFSIRNY